MLLDREHVTIRFYSISFSSRACDSNCNDQVDLLTAYNRWTQPRAGNFNG
jgi:hypothetical protein